MNNVGQVCGGVYRGDLFGNYEDLSDTYEPGDVFTIEPGIYVRADVFEDLPDTPRNRALIRHARAAVARYRNVGVRIEDDYVLTPEGLVRITDVPREIEEIEALRGRPIS